MINLDFNIVAVSLPSISQSLGADFTAIEWVISAYTLAFASLVLPAGSLADRYGRKRMLDPRAHDILAGFLLLRGRSERASSSTSPECSKASAQRSN